MGYVNLGDPEHMHFNRIKLLFSNCFLPTFLFLSVLSIFITRLETTVILFLLFSFSPQTKLLCPSFAAAAAAESRQSCLTLCDPRDSSPPGSPIPGILQVRTLEWAAISFSNAWKWKVKAKSLSSARLLATPWTAAYQAPPSMGFSGQQYWSGMPLPSPFSPY